MIITIALAIVLAVIILAFLPVILGVGVFLIISAIGLAIVAGICYFLFVIVNEGAPLLSNVDWSNTGSYLIGLLFFIIFIVILRNSNEIQNSFITLRVYLLHRFLRFSVESEVIYARNLQIEKQKVIDNFQKKIDAKQKKEDDFIDLKYGELLKEIKLLEIKVNEGKLFIFKYLDHSIEVEPIWHHEKQFHHSVLGYEFDRKSSNHKKFYITYTYDKDDNYYDNNDYYSSYKSNPKKIAKTLARMIGKTLAVANKKPKISISNNEILVDIAKDFAYFLSWYEKTYLKSFDKETGFTVINQLLKKSDKVDSFSEGDELAIMGMAYAIDPIKIIEAREEEEWDKNIKDFMIINNLHIYKNGEVSVI